MSNPASSPAVHIGQTCRRCKRAIPPAEANAHGDELRGFTCTTCYMNHLEAMAALQQQINSGSAVVPSEHRCGDCDKTVTEITALTGRAAMVLVEKDGVMALICHPCNAKFEAKKLDGTTFRGKYSYLSREEFQAKFYSSKMMNLVNTYLKKLRIK